MSALLALSAERIAREIHHYDQIDAEERAWRKAWRWRVVWLGVRCALTYLIGGMLTWGSLGLTGDIAQLAFWGGLLLSNAGPVIFGYAFWMRESGNWG